MALVSPDFCFLNGKIPFHIDKWPACRIYSFNYKINPVKVIIGWQCYLGMTSLAPRHFQGQSLSANPTYQDKRKSQWCRAFLFSGWIKKSDTYPLDGSKQYPTCLRVFKGRWHTKTVRFAELDFTAVRTASLQVSKTLLINYNQFCEPVQFVLLLQG